ncbi:MAG TPA: monofunctional biosynthetic peptidoglycan transglycosylase [bacterium]|nr:monofunctional biosynthetic peptidoglycan transglycosylase [bacterium]
MGRLIQKMARMARTQRRWGWKGLGVAGLGLFAAYQVLAWPDVADLKNENPRTTAFIERYKEREKDAGKKPRIEWTWVPAGRISPDLKRAVAAAEDSGFYSHHGFAADEIQDALHDAWQDRELPRGASTITQQTAKNLWLSPSYNPLRKAKEAVLTIELEHYLTKKRILEIYLNVAEFGPGVFGAEAAARHYFGKSAADLSREEAAQLAAGLPKPAKWHPGCASKGYQRQVQRILRRM